MNLCKSNLLEGLRTIYLGIQNIALGEEMYDYIYIKKLQEKIKTEKTSLDKLRYKTLKMKSAKKLLPGVIPVIKGNEPHIKVVLSPGTEAKIVEVQEIVISTPKAILNEDELKKMTPKKLKDSGLYSASRVPLFNFYSGFPLYKASKFGNYVCIFENSGMYTDTVEGFIPFNYLNVSVLKEYLSIADVKKQHVFLHENRFEIQQAHKYQKLYEQYLQCIKKGKKMNDGSYTVYNRYKNDAKVTNYFEIIEEFKHSLNTKLSPHITSMFNYNFLLNDQQILYEMSMFMSLLEHIDPKKFTVYILETKFKLNEHDIRIKNNETKEEISLQLKALTSTNQYLINEINKNIAKYKKDTNILCVSSSIGNIIEVLDGEKKVITPVHSIFNLTKKFDSTRIFVPECADVTKALAQQQQVLAFKKNVHNELTNNITIHRDTTGVSNESCIKPSSIKKSKIK